MVDRRRVDTSCYVNVSVVPREGMKPSQKRFRLLNVLQHFPHDN